MDFPDLPPWTLDLPLSEILEPFHVSTDSRCSLEAPLFPLDDFPPLETPLEALLATGDRLLYPSQQDAIVTTHDYNNNNVDSSSRGFLELDKEEEKDAEMLMESIASPSPSRLPPQYNTPSRKPRPEDAPLQGRDVYHKTFLPPSTVPTHTSAIIPLSSSTTTATTQLKAVDHPTTTAVDSVIPNLPWNPRKPMQRRASDPSPSSPIPLSACSDSNTGQPFSRSLSGSKRPLPPLPAGANKVRQLSAPHSLGAPTDWQRPRGTLVAPRVASDEYRRGASVESINKMSCQMSSSPAAPQAGGLPSPEAGEADVLKQFLLATGLLSALFSASAQLASNSDRLASNGIQLAGSENTDDDPRKGTPDNNPLCGTHSHLATRGRQSLVGHFMAAAASSSSVATSSAQHLESNALLSRGPSLQLNVSKYSPPTDKPGVKENILKNNKADAAARSGSANQEAGSHQAHNNCEEGRVKVEAALEDKRADISVPALEAKAADGTVSIRGREWGLPAHLELRKASLEKERRHQLSKDLKRLKGAVGGVGNKVQVVNHAVKLLSEYKTTKHKLESRVLLLEGELAALRAKCQSQG